MCRKCLKIKWKWQDILKWKRHSIISLIAPMGIKALKVLGSGNNIWSLPLGFRAGIIFYLTVFLKGMNCKQNS